MNDTRYSCKTNTQNNSGVMRAECGSAIIMLFIVVALFGMLAYAFMHSTRTSTGWFEEEQAKAAQTSSTECQLAISSAAKRLQARGCGNMISDAPDGSNFISGAPADGTCSTYHANGGGVKPCAGTIGDCSGSPAPGTLCEDGTIYAGVSPDGSVSMFTTPADGGSFFWNNGNNAGYVSVTGNNNPGEANTLQAVNTDSDSSVNGKQTHQAAQYCYDLIKSGRDDWYLPARNELNILYTNHIAIGGFDTSPAGIYWSSSENNNQRGRMHDFNTGVMSFTLKEEPHRVRCTRKN